MTFMGKNKKRKKKTPRQVLEASCLRLWKLAVKTRDKFTCQICGARGNHPHHHFTYKSHPSTRYDLHNGLTLCPSCHYKVHTQGHFEKVRRAIVDSIGPEKFEALYRRAYNSDPLTEEQLTNIAEVLNRALDKFRAEGPHQLKKGDFYNGRL